MPTVSACAGIVDGNKKAARHQWTPGGFFVRDVEYKSVMLEVLFYGFFEGAFHFGKGDIEFRAHAEGFFDDVVEVHEALQKKICVD